MPNAQPEKLHEKAQALKQRLKEKGESLETTERRTLRKRLRRLQRKRRRLLVERQRSAAKPQEETPSA